MRRIYSVLSIMGAFIWAATIFLRGTAVAGYGVLPFILGIAPNFGAVWLAAGLGITFWPYVFKRDFDMGKLYGLLGLIIALLLVSEVIHHFLLNAPFDIYDIVASLLAAAILALIEFFGGGEKNIQV